MAGIQEKAAAEAARQEAGEEEVDEVSSGGSCESCTSLPYYASLTVSATRDTTSDLEIAGGILEPRRHS